MKGLNIILIITVALFLSTFSGGCAVETERAEGEKSADKETAAVEEENMIFGKVDETAATQTGEITVDGLGTFSFDPQEVETVREDIFREGYFSIFDVLIHLKKGGQLDFEYHFDEKMNTHQITNLDGHSAWWYDAFYDGGWPEQSVFRMDHYPYKDKMSLEIVRVTDDYLKSVHATYHDEYRRLNENNGKIIIPEVIIEGKNRNMVFENVTVKAYDLRDDMFQPGVITAIDAILSLAEEGKISYDLQWYESIGTAGVVKSYWVNRINDDVSEGRCGFVYEAGDKNFLFFRGNHNHIPSDIRVINSPQYLKYFWICI